MDTKLVDRSSIASWYIDLERIYLTWLRKTDLGMLAFLETQQQLEISENKIMCPKFFFD